jgi:hypothetical protein
MKFVKEEINLNLFTNDMIVYVENTKESYLHTKAPEISNIVRHKDKTQKLTGSYMIAMNQ